MQNLTHFFKRGTIHTGPYKYPRNISFIHIFTQIIGVFFIWSVTRIHLCGEAYKEGYKYPSSVSLYIYRHKSLGALYVDCYIYMRWNL